MATIGRYSLPEPDPDVVAAHPAMCTVADLARGAFGFIVNAYRTDVDYLVTVLRRASLEVEKHTHRRLMPFTLTESYRAEGVDPDDVVTAGSGMPLDLQGALGVSQSLAYGTGGGQVRTHYLSEFAPLWADLWAYQDVTLAMRWPFGGGQVLDASSFEGPEPDSGALTLGVGMLCPPGTRCRVTYSGGYHTIPDDLIQATRLIAIRELMLEVEPEQRQGSDVSHLTQAIQGHLTPYARM